MELTRATDYSFRVVLYLASLKPGTIISAKEIATREGVPMRYLLKTLRSLVQAGILQSYRGPEGGYALAKEPGDISLLDVIQAIEGPIAINQCLVHKDHCSRHWTKPCPVHQALGEVQKKLMAELDKHNFHDLLLSQGLDQSHSNSSTWNS